MAYDDYDVDEVQDQILGRFGSRRKANDRIQVGDATRRALDYNTWLANQGLQGHQVQIGNGQLPPNATGFNAGQDSGPNNAIGFNPNPAPPPTLEPPTGGPGGTPPPNAPPAPTPQQTYSYFQNGQWKTWSPGMDKVETPLPSWANAQGALELALKQLLPYQKATAKPVISQPWASSRDFIRNLDREWFRPEALEWLMSPAGQAWLAGGQINPPMGGQGK